MASAPNVPTARPGFPVKTAIGAAVAIVLVAAMAIDTTVVTIGSEADLRKQGFSAEAYGTSEFPKVQSAVEGRAVDAATLAEAVLADKAAAAKKYGVDAGIAAVVSVKFTGVAGEAKSGIYPVKVEGVPDTINIRVQTGPAINGTDLRDAPGNISFGQFTNQIEYQNAGAALNDAMKKEVLTPVDTANLTGKTMTVTGVFKLINPKNWLVTPVRLSVQ